MKRTAFKLSVFLLLGAVTTVAVAWGCAAWRQPPYEYVSGSPRERFGYSVDGVGYFVEGDSKAGIASYFAAYSTDAGVDDVVWRRFRPPSWAFRVLECYTEAHGDPYGRGEGKISGLLNIQGAGWPVIAMRSHSDPTIDETMGAVRVPAFLRSGTSGDQHYVLPLLPIWGGFAFNTCVFAVAHAALAWAALTSRRLRRFAHGRCPQCTYDLRADYRRPCPECGWRRKGAYVQ